MPPDTPTHGDTLPDNGGSTEAKPITQPNPNQTMTRNQFITACEEAAISCEIALELPGMEDALRDRDDDEVRRILAEEV